MIPSRELPGFCITIVALLAVTSASHAGLGGIQDSGAFFSGQAKAGASRTIGEVERSLTKDIVFDDIP